MERGGWVLLEARLQGGAPWGFTVQGGLEHGEPLVISKVEDGGKADGVELQAGDELVAINDVELTGYRQEAVALVKGSYKTLTVTVRREFDPGYVREPGTPPPPSPPSPRQQSPASSHHSRPRSAEGVQLRIKNRRREPASRPHSWHSTKLGDGRREAERDEMETSSSAWHHDYHSSASTTNLSGGFDSGTYLRKSPDQYSSRGSMESLDPPQSSQLHHGAPHLHPLGPHPAYSSCHQLSSARSSNSIDHLHSKRDSAYSSFSTSSSIPEYLASAPSSSPERSYSLESVPQRGGGGGEGGGGGGGGGGGMQQADLHYLHTVYDGQQVLSQEHKRSSSSSSADPRGGARSGASRDLQVGDCYRGNSSSGGGSSNGGNVPASNRHSVGPIWGVAGGRSSCESLRGAPAPPRRSDSYAAIRNHDRPNSWSSVDHARSLRSLQKGSWHHSSGPVASGAAKGSYGTEGQLHTVMEKSPESSPTTKPRQGGAFSPDSSSSRLLLPVYPVPQPGPHYAQGPGPSSAHPVLANEGGRQHRQGPRAREEGERQNEGKISRQNGHNNDNISSSSSSSSSSSYSTSSQLGMHAHGTDSRPQQEEEESNIGPAHRHNVKRSEGHTPKPQNHQEPQSFHGSGSQKGQVSQNQHHGPRTSRDTHTPVHLRGDSSRSVDQNLIHWDPATFSRPTQGQVPPGHSPVWPQAPPTSQTPPHLSDQHWDEDGEHPLTRLELALAEVQRCAAIPEASASNHGNNSSSTSLEEGGQGPSRSLSVLEKVSRFERRERDGKQRSLSTSHTHSKAPHLRMNERGCRSPCGADDLRNMLERSTSGTKAHRTLSYRGTSSDYAKHRTPADPSSALQRSRSSFHLDGSREAEEEVLASTQDVSHSRSYRDSLKDAQSKVLGSTSFRRRDLSSSSSSIHQPPSVSTKHHSLEKRGPQTMPKPQGVVIRPQSPPPTGARPHAPKERQAVSLEVRGPSPPALPSVPPVGPAALTRICGRKRLLAEQKKRSFSEPENMNEVGVSDTETTAPFRRGGETSVADRRRMFEMAASRVVGGASQNATSKPELRQIQHDALAEYVERKRSVRGGPRPRSAYLQPDNNMFCSQSETFSLSSASSLLSLQDIPVRSLSRDRRPPGDDVRNHQSDLFYPGRVTSPRAPALKQHTAELQDASPGLSRQLDGALQRAGSRSASAEDLLERFEERAAPPQYQRSRSSPTLETKTQDFPPGDVGMFGVFTSQPGRRSPPDDRPADIPLAIQIISDSGSSPFTPVTRRERQRNGERQRALSASKLAASVGLPCPFLSPEWTGGERLSLASTDGISFPGGDAAAATAPREPPVTHRQTRRSLSDGVLLEDAERDAERDEYRGRAHSLETRGGGGGGHAPDSPPSHSSRLLEAPPNRKESGNAAAWSTSCWSLRHLSSLRISESSEQTPLETSMGRSLQDFNEVFLHDPPPPSPPSPVTETSITEDFPPPPHMELDEEHGYQSEESPSSDFSSVPNRKSSSSSSLPFPPPPPSFPPPPVLLAAYRTPEENLSLEYQPLSGRERTPQEVRVEVLSRRLLLQDSSLTSVLDTWDTKSTVDLVREIFPNSRWVEESQRRHAGSPTEDDHRIQDGLWDSASDGGAETETEENDLNARKLELCAALRSSVEALQQEKEELCEEQRRHQELGSTVDALVQQHLKTNERDKYSVFIGDLEKIVHLLLSLCSRLSRINRSLLALQREEHEDTVESKDSLHHKRSLLLRQTEDAWELKENLDRRQRVVHAILSGHLTDTQLHDYRRFVSTKPSLLIRRRHLEDLIRQGEEQLARLAESLPTEARGGVSRANSFISTAPYSSSIPQLVTPPTHPVRTTAVTSL